MLGCRAAIPFGLTPNSQISSSLMCITIMQHSLYLICGIAADRKFDFKPTYAIGTYSFQCIDAHASKMIGVLQRLELKLLPSFGTAPAKIFSIMISRPFYACGLHRLNSGLIPTMPLVRFPFAKFNVKRHKRDASHARKLSLTALWNHS